MVAYNVSWTTPANSRKVITVDTAERAEEFLMDLHRTYREAAIPMDTLQVEVYITHSDWEEMI